MVMTTLAHHIGLAWLYEAYRQTRKDGAVGVDGQTSREYGANLMENLKDLLERFKSGRYKAPPVRRVYIPKGDGRQRPLGIPTYEDKILQRAVTMVLEMVYEQDFYDCSYGFRPGRNQHQALGVLRQHLMDMRGGWVLDLDIKGYFDNINHQHLRDFLDQRVRDGVIRRAIDKWLKAGVMEKGIVKASEQGSPQGGVVSPLISNIYLHEVLDKWFAEAVRPRMKGRAAMLRFADDAVLVFERKEDVDRVMKVIGQRFARYGLQLHPEKTKLVRFRRPPDAQKKENGKPETFNFLGFTFYWGKSRRGWWVVKMKTAKDRLKKALERVKEWCKTNRHLKLRAQHEKLAAKLVGHYHYYGVTGNFQMIERFYRKTQDIWWRWLRRRSQSRHLSKPAFYRKQRANPLPRPFLPLSVYRNS